MSSDEKHIDAKAVAANADTKNIDQAALFLAEAEGFEPLTAKQEQRLKRKIDFILIPMVILFNSLRTLSLTMLALRDGHTWRGGQSGSLHSSHLRSAR